MEALGASLVAISPQLPPLNAEVKQKHRITYPVLTDRGNTFAHELGVVHPISDDLRQLYEGFGINLTADQDLAVEEPWELPLATRLVVDRDGTIVSADADPDYTIRPEPEATLEVLKALS